MTGTCVSVPGAAPPDEHDVEVVVAADPVPTDPDRVRDGPVEAEQAVARIRPGVRARQTGVRAAAGRRAADQPPARAVVPAEPVDLDAIGRRRVGGHVEVDRLAGLDAHLGGERVERPVRRLLPVPGSRARARVLGLDRVSVRRRLSARVRAVRGDRRGGGKSERGDGEGPGGSAHDPGAYGARGRPALRFAGAASTTLAACR